MHGGDPNKDSFFLAALGAIAATLLCAALSVRIVGKFASYLAKAHSKKERRVV